MTITQRIGKAAAVAISLAFILPAAAFADTTPDFTATQTVANTSQTKATRTLTVANALPAGTVAASSVNFTIGDCVVTLGTVAQDTNCTDHAAAIATTTDTTAALIATRLISITGIADTGRAGGLTVTASTTSNTSAVFTTTATETAAGNITYTAGTATNVTSPASSIVAGVVPVAQSVTFTPTNGDDGDTFSLTVNGSTYSRVYELHDTIQLLVENLASQLTATTSVSCSENDLSVTCGAATAGTAFTYSASVIDFVPVSSGGSSHHSSGGGGGSSHSSSANNGTVTASPAPAAQAHASSNAAFNRDLTAGVSGSDVMDLQKYLNAHGFVVAASGPGSVGNETMLFGALTKAAVIKLQMAAGITPAVGYFGPKTRAYVAAHP